MEATEDTKLVEEEKHKRQKDDEEEDEVAFALAAEI